MVFGWHGDEWEREVVDAGGDGLCGTGPELTFDGEGLPVVAYGCARPKDDGFEQRLEVARREVLR